MLLWYFMPCWCWLVRGCIRFSSEARTLGPVRRVARAVPLDERPHEVGALQDDASARGLCGRLAEIPDERRFLQDHRERPRIVDRLLRELDDRTRLDG
jgi:hypothetical protein